MEHTILLAASAVLIFIVAMHFVRYMNARIELLQEQRWQTLLNTYRSEGGVISSTEYIEEMEKFRAKLDY